MLVSWFVCLFVCLFYYGTRMTQRGTSLLVSWFVCLFVCLFYYGNRMTQRGTSLLVCLFVCYIMEIERHTFAFCLFVSIMEIIGMAQRGTSLFVYLFVCLFVFIMEESEWHREAQVCLLVCLSVCVFVCFYHGNNQNGTERHKFVCLCVCFIIFSLCRELYPTRTLT